MKSAIIALLLLVLLSACAPVRSNEALTAPDIIIYPAEVMEQAAQEMELGTCPVLNTLTVDYGVMRDQSRVLKGESVNISR